MSARFSLDDYVDVAERIALFYERYPEGSLRGEWVLKEVGERTFVVYRAEAYRTPDDSMPGQGTAWEPFPGSTPYTRDSELMNAETAAWGRAIVALGILANRKVASRQEVRARQGEQTPAPANGKPVDRPQTPPAATLDDARATTLERMAKTLVDGKVWTGRALKAQLVAAGARDTSSVGVAVRSLSTEQADALEKAMEQAVGAPA